MMFDDEMPAAPEIIIPTRTPAANAWPEELFEVVKKFWAEGKSATEIGRLVGKSRCAIMGKIMRGGLRRGPGMARRDKSTGDKLYNIQKVRKMARNHKVYRVAGSELRDLPADMPDNPISLFDLEPRHCRWPCTGAGIDVVFCGGGALPSHSYCARHCRMSYEPPKRRAPEKYWNRNGAAA